MTARRAELEEEMESRAEQQRKAEASSAAMESHALAERKQEQMRVLRGALGVNDQTREGDAFNRELQEQRRMERLKEREQREREREEARAREAKEKRRREKEAKVRAGTWARSGRSVGWLAWATAWSAPATSMCHRAPPSPCPVAAPLRMSPLRHTDAA